MRLGGPAPILLSVLPPGGRALRSRSGPHTTLCALIALLALCAPGRLHAQDADHIAMEGGLGVAAAIGTLVYAPLKLTSALGGLVLGSITYLWTGGNSDVTDPVFKQAMGGDYVISPDHIRGNDGFELTGE